MPTSPLVSSIYSNAVPSTISRHFLKASAHTCIRNRSHGASIHVVGSRFQVRAYVWKMAPAGAEKNTDKSYLSAVNSINPWASNRQATSTENSSKNSKDSRLNEHISSPVVATAPTGTGVESSVDHSITHLYGQSFRTYPADCPQMNVQWFHAVDVGLPCVSMRVQPAKRLTRLPGTDAKATDGPRPPSAPWGCETPGPTQEVCTVLFFGLEGDREQVPETTTGKRSCSRIRLHSKPRICRS